MKVLGRMKSPERMVQFRTPALMIAELKQKRKPPSPHWYKVYVGECPVCGRDASYRTRVYGEKPQDIQECRIYLSDGETYCGCVR